MRFLAGVLMLAVVPPLYAGGPRWVAGAPFYTVSGVPVVWKQSNLLYSTDPGGLSASVNHAAADALVATAAGVWNLPVARITVAQGGVLAEHVSGANVYLDSAGMVWPADVEAANSAAIPLAVVYDTDGSVIEALEGAGASNPEGCAQSGVVETVDRFDPGGYILHAIVVINGRCTGPAPEQQTQLEYQLMRVFGRVLGMAWSQTNDNVFTGSTTPTYDQEMHWPLMHPIEIVCGLYSFQCLPDPFTPRPDDVAAMTLLYPVTGTPAAGKQVSAATEQAFSGQVSFATGEGMEGVNVEVVRWPRFSASGDGWFEVSAVSGSSFRRNGGPAFLPAGSDEAASEGTMGSQYAGIFQSGGFPILGPYDADELTLSTEPLNPLYTGPHSVGPYAAGVVSPAGSPPLSYTDPIVGAGGVAQTYWVVGDAPPVCGTGVDGTFALPMALPATGWWTGTICGYGHASYVSATVRAGRTYTLEMTALDGNGFATTTKLMPVMGVYAASDAAGAVPSLALQATAFNALGLGMTSLPVASGAGGAAETGGGTVKLALADQRGDGRPDFPYQARFLYADSLAPTAVPAGGGTVTISGTGFRQGNAVSIHGVDAAVSSWTANTIVLTAPPASATGAAPGTSVDVEVEDRGTGATTAILGGLTYGAVTKASALLLISAPSGTQWVGRATNAPLTVKLVEGDGMTPVPGQPVTLSIGMGGAGLAVCGGAATCTVMSDGEGEVSSFVLPSSAGGVTLKAVAGGLSVVAGFTAQIAASTMQVTYAPAGPEPVSKTAMTPFTVRVLAPQGATGQQGGVNGDAITFSIAPGSAGSVVFSGCGLAMCTAFSNTGGFVSMTVTPVSAGVVTLVASDPEGLTAQATFTAVNAPDVLVLTSPGNQTAVVGTYPSMSVRLFASDGVTGMGGQVVLFQFPAGLSPRNGGSPQEQFTDYFGQASTGATASTPGIYAMTANFGSLSVVQTFTFIAPPPSQLSFTSVPPGVLMPGVQASVPVTAHLTDGYGDALSGVAVSLSGPTGALLFSCGSFLCRYLTDDNGDVSSAVTPLQSGVLAISAAAVPIRTSSSVVTTALLNVAGSAPVLNVLQAPPPTVTVGTSVTFQVQLLGANGAPLPGALVEYQIGGTFANPFCYSGQCKSWTDANGLMTVTGTASTPGPVTITVDIDGLAAQASFTVVAAAMSMKVITAPAGTAANGAAETPFAVEIVGADGVTPVSGQNVTFAVSGGLAGFAACSSIPCVVKTGANGKASTGAIVSSAAGLVTLLASDNGMTATASYTVAALPDLLQPVSAVTGAAAVGVAASPAFVVRVVLADGVTPDPGKAVSFAVNAGSVRLGECALPCTVVSAADGTAGVTLTPLAAGVVSVGATLGSAAVNDLFHGANVLGLGAGEPRTWIAEGATVEMELEAAAVENGSVAGGVALVWTSNGPFRTVSASSKTGTLGTGAMQATAGPLAAGANATVTACAWTSVCAGFEATGVSAAVWQLAMVSGGAQTASGGAMPAPVTVKVTDGQGHAVAGAPVTIGQTAYADDGSCPATGRCPPTPVLASEVTVATSDLAGEVSVQPLRVAATATRTAMSFSSGTQGFVTAEVMSAP